MLDYLILIWQYAVSLAIILSILSAIGLFIACLIHETAFKIITTIFTIGVLGSLLAMLTHSIKLSIFG